MIHDEQVTPSGQRHLDLTPDQWNLLSQLVVVLKPLQVATTALCQRTEHIFLADPHSVEWASEVSP